MPRKYAQRRNQYKDEECDCQLFVVWLRRTEIGIGWRRCVSIANEARKQLRFGIVFMHFHTPQRVIGSVMKMIAIVSLTRSNTERTDEYCNTC